MAVKLLKQHPKGLFVNELEALIRENGVKLGIMTKLHFADLQLWYNVPRYNL